MYKLLLCWRYLRTRYIALASIISVMLGVATMIVVNSVMAGFTQEMQDRIHGIISDVVLGVKSVDGAEDAAWHMDAIRRAAGDAIEGMTATVEVPAMLTIHVGDETITRQVQLIGVDPRTQGAVSDFAKYLQHPKNRQGVSFELREGGYDTRDHQAGPEAPQREQMAKAGWEHRRTLVKSQAFGSALDGTGSGRAAPPRGEASAAGVDDPFTRRAPTPENRDATEQETGLVLGIALASYRSPDGKDHFVLLPGEDVEVTFPAVGVATSGTGPKIVSRKFTIVDFYECKMSEYDASFVFVPIDKLQQYRGMVDPSTGTARFNSIQIKLKPGYDGAAVRDKIRESGYFTPVLYAVQTWQDRQGALLAAVHMETAILNLLLFLIIAVSGFGILAIFFMIVVEKTRDIGILKSLGASGTGIMWIFLSYGLALGLVGSGIGLFSGLLFVWNINEIADLLGVLTGRPVFDPTIYYFYKIPTLVSAWTVAWIMLGAMGIAVLASIVPALRAAMLHPVEALRYE